eukprot:14912338-Heterocapsa_arctica.AAC.1
MPTRNLQGIRPTGDGDAPGLKATLLGADPKRRADRRMRPILQGIRPTGDDIDEDDGAGWPASHSPPPTRNRK